MIKTYQKNYNENNVSFLLTDRKEYLTQREEIKDNSRKGLNNEKSFASTKFNKKKFIAFLKDIEINNSKKRAKSDNKVILINKEKIVTDLNFNIKNS